MIQLNRLRVKNFRCFQECSVDFDEKLTVFVSRNGQGKTTLLDAVALALGLFVDTLGDRRQSAGFNLRDIHRHAKEGEGTTPADYVEFEAKATIAGEPVSWKQRRNSGSVRTRTTKKDAGSIIEAATSLRSRSGGDSGDTSKGNLLPLIAYFGTDRRGRADALYGQRASLLGLRDRWAGYADCLHASAGFKFFSEWYESTVRKISEPSTGVQDPARPERLLAAVNTAVDSVLEAETGWHELRWSPVEEELTLTHKLHGKLPLSFLSDGVRATAALVADVAHRCVRLNPHLGQDAASRTPGILLIDEIELHLHPEWQQRIIEMMQSTFPAIQLLVSTHSPQVLSAVDVKSIRTVRIDDEDMPVSTPKFQTRGVESADVLAEIMGVDPIAKVPEAQKLSDYRALIEEGKQETDEALSLRAELIGHFGSLHPLMLDCERLIRFSDFKRKRKESGGKDAQT